MQGWSSLKNIGPDDTFNGSSYASLFLQWILWLPFDLLYQGVISEYFVVVLQYLLGTIFVLGNGRVFEGLELGREDLGKLEYFFQKLYPLDVTDADILEGRTHFVELLGHCVNKLLR